MINTLFSSAFLRVTRHRHAGEMQFDLGIRFFSSVNSVRTSKVNAVISFDQLQTLSEESQLTFYLNLY